MDQVDVIVIGSGLNAFAIVQEAYRKGYQVSLVRPTQETLMTYPTPPCLISSISNSTQQSLAERHRYLNAINALTLHTPECIHWLKLLKEDKHDKITTSLIEKLTAYWFEKKLNKIYLKNHLQQNDFQLGCVIDTQYLIKLQRQYIQQQSISLYDADIENITRNEQAYQVKLFNHKLIATKAIINATSSQVIKNARAWFHLPSRCNVQTHWLHQIQLPSTKNNVMFNHHAAQWTFYADSQHKGYLFYYSADYEPNIDIEQFALTLLQKNRLIESESHQFMDRKQTPFIAKQSFVSRNDRSYLIDCITDRNQPPIFNLISNDSLFYQTIAKKCIYNLKQSISPSNPI